MSRNRKHRRIVAIIGVAALIMVLFGFAFVSRPLSDGDGRYSRLLPPTQWGFGSGVIVSTYYTNGVPTRTEQYAFEKHGYYEVRRPCDQTTPCK